MDLRIDKTAKNMNTIKSTIQQSIDGVKRIEVWDTHRHTHKHSGHVSICSHCGRYGHENHELASGGPLQPQTAPAVLNSEIAQMWGECVEYRCVCASVCVCVHACVHLGVCVACVHLCVCGCDSCQECVDYYCA